MPKSPTQPCSLPFPPRPPVLFLADELQCASDQRGLASDDIILTRILHICIYFQGGREIAFDCPLQLTFRRWRRQFPAIFCGWLLLGVEAKSRGPVISHPRPRFPATLTGVWPGSQVPRTGHLPPEASLSRHAGWRGAWKPGSSDPVTPVNPSIRHPTGSSPQRTGIQTRSCHVAPPAP